MVPAEVRPQRHSPGLKIPPYSYNIYPTNEASTIQEPITDCTNGNTAGVKQSTATSTVMLQLTLEEKPRSCAAEHHKKSKQPRTTTAAAPLCILDPHWECWLFIGNYDLMFHLCSDSSRRDGSSSETTNSYFFCWSIDGLKCTAEGTIFP